MLLHFVNDVAEGFTVTVTVFSLTYSSLDAADVMVIVAVPVKFAATVTFPFLSTATLFVAGLICKLRLVQILLLPERGLLLCDSGFVYIWKL